MSVRSCVIFNPAAKGDKARHFRRRLDVIASNSGLKKTDSPGDAQRLAAEAVSEGYENIVAAGGDGTLNEVLNGIGLVPGGFDRVRLGLLPLGTVNVFARELGLPLRVEDAWDAICRSREMRIDLPLVEFSHNGAPQRRYFAQLAGAGLDASAIERVNWPLKKKVGPMAYIWAGLKALFAPPSKITVAGRSAGGVGELVLVGNGHLYGGPFSISPKADLRDGLLDLCIFPRVNWFTLLRCAPGLLLRGRLPASSVRRFQADAFTLSSSSNTAFETDGELAGRLPAAFSVQRAALRVIVP